VKASVPQNEKARLEALYEYQILDTLPEQAYDDITRLASTICGTPIALVSLVDRERQWFKSNVGLAVNETSRECSFCAHAIHHPELFLIPDATADARFADNPLVTAEPHIRFYGGAPLITHDGLELGTLCVIDVKPRRLTSEQEHALEALSRQVMAQLELRRKVQQLESAIESKEEIAAELRLQKSILEAQSEASPDGILVLSQDERILSFNQRFLQLWGLSPEMMGQQLNETVLAAIVNKLVEPQRWLDKIADLRVQQESESRDEMMLLDGRIFDWYSAPIKNSQGALHGRVWFTRDITERKEIERIKTEFISTVSHELRTPLTSIRGSLGLIAGGVTGAVSEKAKSLLNIAINNNDRLIRLINDILDLDKIEAGQMVFQEKPLEIMPLLEAAVAENRAYAEQFGVELFVEPGLPEVKVKADSDRLMQVMANLLSNAAKFSPPNGQVTLSATRQQGMVRVAVQDHGPGIPEEFRSRIFDKFAQADASDSRHQGGTGLGLSIAKNIVERMGGRIGFKTQVGAGTTFYFELPEWGAPEAGKPQTSMTEALGTDIAKRQGRILVCEDDHDVAHLLTIMLQRGGFETDVAHNAQEAKALALENRYVAMTLDLELPGQDGISLVRELRSEAGEIHSGAPYLPIIVVSAMAPVGQAELDGDAFGIIDWLDKPINPDHLLAAVEQAARQRRKGAFGVSPAMQPEGEMEGERAKRKARILHVEDELDVCRITTMVLADVAEMVCVTTLQEAKEQLEGSCFDLVIIDLSLPDGSGLELLSMTNQHDPPIPVVIFSAEEMRQGLTHNIAGTLVKTRASNAELLQTIQSIVQANHSTCNSVN